MNLLFIPSWQAIAVRGAFALLFGLGAFLWPGVTLATLVLLFGVYALLDGIVAILVGSRLRATDRGWVLPLEGLLGAAFGLFAIVWTGATAAAITVLIGVWAFFTGGLELTAAIRLRRDIPGEAFLAFGGAASIVLGGLLLLFPGLGTLLLVVVLGSYAIVFGSAMLMLAMQLRGRERRTHSRAHVAVS